MGVTTAKPPGRKLTTSKNLRLERLIDVFLPLIAVLGALLIGAVVLVLLNVNPVEAYTAMFSGAFTNKNGLADTLVKATPLMLVGLGIVIAFRANVINIGAEGQLIVGALLTTYLGLQLGESMSAWLVIPLCVIGGTLMGGIWGAIPGYLKARLGVNEILSTIMMNQIAIQIGYYLLRGPMIDPKELEAGTNIPHSARLDRAVDLPRFTDVAKTLGFDQTAKQLEMTGFQAEIYGLLVEPTQPAYRGWEPSPARPPWPLTLWLLPNCTTGNRPCSTLSPNTRPAKWAARLTRLPWKMAA